MNERLPRSLTTLLRTSTGKLQRRHLGELQSA
jgi:hypothetical protein